jgi:hypothetical protein
MEGSRVETREGRTWIINAFVYFLPILFIWVVAVLWVGSTFGDNLKFLSGLKTSLFADYGPDPFGRSLKSLSLAIFGDVFSDSDMSSDSMIALEIALRGPVPSATPGPGEVATSQTSNIGEPSLTPVVDTSPTDTQQANQENTKPPVSTKTPTVTPSPRSYQQSREKVVPLLECVIDNGDETYIAYFGYKNHNSFQVEIPIGAENNFTPGSKDRGQPSSFAPGRSSPYPNSSFQVVFDGNPLTWHLDGETTTAFASSNRCEALATPTPNDTASPQISGGTLDPSPGNLDNCCMIITIDDLHVVDPSPSSGIVWVKLKYNVEGYSSGYVFSNPLNLCSGGPTGDGGWDGCYSGSIKIEIDPEWISPAPELFHINVWTKARDNAGNETVAFQGQYTMPASCGQSGE